MFLNFYFIIILRDGLCLQEVLDILEDNNDDIQDIFIEPPDVSQLTDEDSGDDDGGGLIDNLSGKLLTSRAEVRFHSQNINTIPDISINVSTEQPLLGEYFNLYILYFKIKNLSTYKKRNINFFLF